jgi:S-adenosylmethionine:tRNA ribosyltransferase-isomerase
VERAEVVLHVGMGTFKPVETEFVEQHAMHGEWCSVPSETARAIADRPPNSRILAVGTTTARTLESYASPDEMLTAPSKDTHILITPGHRFRHVGALMTNFHLPRSTLLAMVAAFLDDDDRVRGRGLTRLLEAYRVAVEMGYRFYSFGDAMLILP